MQIRQKKQQKNKKNNNKKKKNRESFDLTTDFLIEKY